jgi:hypothetical protein
MNGAESFRALARTLLAQPDVEEGTGFGSRPGLRVQGHIFAMLIDGALVVKLPAHRCTVLVATHTARPFDRGQNRPLKEWVVVSESHQWQWRGLAQEAIAYVRR